MQKMTRKRSLRRRVLALVVSVSANAQSRETRPPAPPGLHADTWRPPLAALHQQREVTGRIQGVVFDSLLMKPLARASVMLMGTGRSTISDDRGRFSFDTVAAGAHEVGFSSKTLDSLGLGVLGAAVSVAPNQSVRVTVATPSLSTLWRNRCGAHNTFGTDSTIVWGTVRDAASDSLVSGFATSFSWYDLRPKKAAALVLDELQRATFTDNSGHYFACGLPPEIMIAGQALGVKAASGRIEYVIGARRLHYMDLMVSTDMVVPDTMRAVTREDSVNVSRLRGRATLRGAVVDDKGSPLADATVMLADLDTTVVTGADGQFVLRSLPSGTHLLFVRRVGSGATKHVVQLRPEMTTEATVRMSAVTTLAAVNVRAEKVIGRDRLDFEYRKKAGFGYAMDEARIKKHHSLASVLSTFPGLKAQPNGGQVSLSMRTINHGASGGVSECTPTVYLDGILSNTLLATSLQVEQYRAVEVYPRYVLVPAEFARKRGCGAILFWSKSSRW